MTRFFKWLRIFLKALTLSIGVLWLSSYYIGLQRYQSNWSSKGTDDMEEARWFISNFGSFGYAWRSQRGELGIELPPSYSLHTAYKGSSSAHDHIHPEGFAAWHWFHHPPQDNRKIGKMQTAYGHLFIPYWVLFLASAFLILLFSNRLRKRFLSGSDTVAEEEPAGEKAEGNEAAKQTCEDTGP